MFRNPITLAKTDAFVVQVFPPTELESVASYTFTLQMKTLASFRDFRLTPNNLTTGVVTSYSVALIAG